MRELLLVRYGEVFLKGQNRPFFLRKLIDHVREAVSGVGAAKAERYGKQFLREIAAFEDRDH